MRWMNGLVFGLALSSFAYAEDEAKLKAEMEEIEKGYQAALEEFFRPLREAKTQEEKEKVAFDWEKHPLKEWLPKVQDVATRGKGTDAAVPALVWILVHASEGGRAAEGTHAAALDELLASHIGSPLLQPVPQALQYNCVWVLGRARTEEALATIVEKSPHASVRAAGLYHSGGLLLDDPGASEADRARARALFDRLTKEHPDTEWARMAQSYVFELENLQVGKAAPDFEAVDADGAKFKLSDYRGKVVVVKFWGFW